MWRRGIYRIVIALVLAALLTPAASLAAGASGPVPASSWRLDLGALAETPLSFSAAAR